MTDLRSNVVGSPMLLCGLLLIAPGQVAAQYVQSERASVSQTMEGTTISIEYGRPRIKGRGEPFGDIAWIGDHRWTPGADEATVLSTNRAFRLNGHDVPAGGWSMWIDLEHDGFTLVLDPDSVGYHTSPPDDRDGQIHIPLETREGPFVETMMFSVPTTRLSGFDLVLSWGTTEIPMTVEVGQTYARPIDAAEARRMTGSFAFRPPEYSGPPMPFVIRWEDGALRARTVLFGKENDGIFGVDYNPESVELIPRGAGIFWEGYVRDGRLFDLETDVAYEAIFAADGTLENFEIRWPDDTVAGTLEPHDFGDDWDAIVHEHTYVPEETGRELTGAYTVFSADDSTDPRPLDFTWVDGMLLIASEHREGGPGSSRLLPRSPDTFWIWDWNGEYLANPGMEYAVVHVVRSDDGSLVGFDMLGPDGEAINLIRPR